MYIVISLLALCTLKGIHAIENCTKFVIDVYLILCSIYKPHFYQNLVYGYKNSSLIMPLFSVWMQKDIYLDLIECMYVEINSLL